MSKRPDLLLLKAEFAACLDSFIEKEGIKSKLLPVELGFCSYVWILVIVLVFINYVVFLNSKNITFTIRKWTHAVVLPFVLFDLCIERNTRVGLFALTIEIIRKKKHYVVKLADFTMKPRFSQSGSFCFARWLVWEHIPKSTMNLLDFLDNDFTASCL